MSTRGKDIEEDDGEDEDLTNFEMVAADANPVERKQKKSLDLRWKELVKDDDNVDFRNKKEHKSDGNAKSRGVKKELKSTELEVVKSHEPKVGNGGIDVVQSSFGNGMQSTIKSKNTTSHSRHVGAGVEPGSTSMESEIDAENRARLEKMSTEEIAEAQAEIMKKMNPELIKILQKRGQNKMKKESSINSAAIGSIAEAYSDNTKKKSTSDNAHSMIITGPDHIQKGLVSKDVPEIKSSATSLWDSWSTNVEAARDLRFSLDGDLINDYRQGPGIFSFGIIVC